MGKSVGRAAMAAAICTFSIMSMTWNAAAQDDLAPASASGSLNLSDTKIASRAGGLGLSTSPKTAVEQLTLQCPTVCTIRVEFWTQLLKLNTAVEAVVDLLGATGKFMPSRIVTLVSGAPEGLFTSSFTVWKDALPAGSYTVRVRLRLRPLLGGDAGSEAGGAGARTLTAQVYEQ